MRKILIPFLSLLVTLTVSAESAKDTPHAKKTLEIYRKVISIPTVAGRGKVPEMANYLASQLRQAGFEDKDFTDNNH